MQTATRRFLPSTAALALTAGLLAAQSENPLTVLPLQGVEFAARADGTSSPASHTHTLVNGTERPIEWRASTSAEWLLVSPSSGVVPAGSRLDLETSVSAAVVRRLGEGDYAAALSVAYGGDGGTPLRRRVELSVTEAGGPRTGTDPGPGEPTGETREVLTQFEIRWTFDRPYEVGQFANGDWWVVGPVKIIGIDPPSIGFGGRTMNGSMVNPRPTEGIAQGFDSAMYGKYASARSYAPDLNVALDVSPARPLVLQPHTSLVSTISRTEPGIRPQTATAAILTVLPRPAPEGAFRPPYTSTDKSIRFTTRDLDLTRLARLAPVPGTPGLPEVARAFERPWIDFIPGWVGRYTHPYRNMPDYGREMADKVGWGSLMLNLNFPDEEKHELLVRYVQVGIDFFGILENGGRANWQAGDGHHSGRKWPILFAGLLLGDPDMQGIGLDPTLLFMGEDGQTFYVEETEPGVYNHGNGGYGPEHVGMPEWGKKHALRPSFDNAEWNADPYRVCCTANSWYGEVLSAWIMGAKELWNHDALFDYQDRYRRTTRALGSPPWMVAWSEFPLVMWDTYRQNYGTSSSTSGVGPSADRSAGAPARAGR